MRKLRVPGVALALWAAMLWYCLPHDAHHIQHDLTSKTAAVLAANNFSASSMTVDGRDIVLSGNEGAPEVSDGAVKLVKAIWGVRTVRINIVNRGAAPKSVVTVEQAHAAAAAIAGILKLRNVEFYSGSDRLTPDGQRTLSEVATVLGKYPGMPVEIAGHTDSNGVPAENLHLSRLRAESVKRYLMNKGIAGGNLTPLGFGQTQPIAGNETAAGRQANRRVEFHTKETR
jgi:outer membrane protein OmpA-like peptidoglycan-associated protein